VQVVKIIIKRGISMINKWGFIRETKEKAKIEYQKALTEYNHLEKKQQENHYQSLMDAYSHVKHMA
jgi:hypothetical protein